MMSRRKIIRERTLRLSRGYLRAAPFQFAPEYIIIPHGWPIVLFEVINGLSKQ